MRRIFLITFLMVTAIAGSQATGTPQASKPRIISITRVVRIPLKPVRAEGSLADSTSNSPDLAVSPGGVDETPEGPNSFDVFDDSSILVTDPLMDRLSVFSSEGRFKRSVTLGFAADSVKIRSDGDIEVRDARTAATYVLDNKGAKHPSESMAAVYSAKVISPQAGTVTRGGEDGRFSPISVQLDRPGFTLLSLELIGVGEDGSSYVAVESTPGTGNGGITVSKSVRRYSAEGTLVSQTDEIPLDYYVTPIDELRVRKGVVYQLMTTASEVRVNVWNMN